MLRGANFSLTHFAIRLDLAGLFIENKKAKFITLRTFRLLVGLRGISVGTRLFSLVLVY